MDNSHFIDRAKKDLEFIFESFKKCTFTYNDTFTEKTNSDLEDLIINDLLMTKMGQMPETKTVFNVHAIKNISVDEIKPFLSFITKQKGYTRVIITALVDYYWIVGGQESSIPGEIETEQILKNTELSFTFRYREINGQWLLAYYFDDNGCDFGEGRTWPGKPELMKQYRENPDILNA